MDITLTSFSGRNKASYKVREVKKTNIFIVCLVKAMHSVNTKWYVIIQKFFGFYVSCINDFFIPTFIACRAVTYVVMLKLKELYCGRNDGLVKVENMKEII